jgi:hypothetical protein
MYMQATMTAAEVEATARKLGVRLFQTCVKENVDSHRDFVCLLHCLTWLSRRR